MIVRIAPALKIEPLQTGGALVFSGATGATSFINDQACALLNNLLVEGTIVSEENHGEIGLAGAIYSQDIVVLLEKSGLVICS